MTFFFLDVFISGVRVDDCGPCCVAFLFAFLRIRMTELSGISLHPTMSLCPSRRWGRGDRGS